MNCWQILGIAPTSDEATIKQAYAACIREHRPDRDPEGFRRVRAAYEEALRQREFIRPRHEKKRRREADAPSTRPEPPQNPLANSYYGYTATLPPEISETLREPENVAYLNYSATNEREPAPHDYLDRSAASEREPAPHDYLDRPADAQENPAALLARLQAAWETAASDAALLVVLQEQANEPALQHIDLRSDYLFALRDWLIAAAPLPQSTVWAGERYQLQHDQHSKFRRVYLAALLARLQAAWETAASDAALLVVLQAQSVSVEAQNIDFRLDYTAALQAYIAAHAYPHSRLWVQNRYGLREPDSRRRLADLILTGGDPDARDSLLAHHYPALAAWLQRNPLLRWCALYSHWARDDRVAIEQNWQHLQDALPDVPLATFLATWPALRALCAPWRQILINAQAFIDIFFCLIVLLLGFLAIVMLGGAILVISALTIKYGYGLSIFTAAGIALYHLYHYLKP